MGTFIAVFLCMVLGGAIAQIVRAELWFGRLREIYPEILDMIRRGKAMLVILEGQNTIREASVNRVVDEVRDVKRDTVRAADVAAQARDAAAAAIDKVPEKVAALLKPGDSGAEWKQGDADRRSPGNGGHQ